MRCLLPIALALTVTVPALAQAPATTTHQGYLEQNGTPVNGSVNLTFRLFTAASGGTQLWTETQNGVPVTDGVYGVTLGSVMPLSSVNFNQPLWLEEAVGGTTLLPRTRLSGVPYALGMRLPATLTGALGDALLTVRNDGASGTGVYGFATATSGFTEGVYGESNSTTGVGVFGRANATSGATFGVWGDNHSSEGTAVYGRATATTGFTEGVYGESNSTTGVGVFGRANATSGATYGVWGQSASPSGYGIYGTNTGGGPAARFDAAVRVFNGSGGSPKIILDPNFNGDGRVITQELQINGGSDLAEHFDVAPLPGLGAPLPGMVVSIDPAQPGRLAVATAPYDPLVAGVVSGAGGVNTGFLMGQEGSIADGDTPVALVGRVYVLVDAAHGPVRPGDLLTTSATPGHAMRAADRDRSQGAVLGKAMTGLEEGRGLVLVLVGLQ